MSVIRYVSSISENGCFSPCWWCCCWGTVLCRSLHIHSRSLGFGYLGFAWDEGAVRNAIRRGFTFIFAIPRECSAVGSEGHSCKTGWGIMSSYRRQKVKVPVARVAAFMQVHNPCSVRLLGAISTPKCTQMRSCGEGRSEPGSVLPSLLCWSTSSHEIDVFQHLGSDLSRILLIVVFC